MRYALPQGGPARIDWGNPITEALQAVILPLGGMVDVTSQTLPTTDSGTKAVSKTGLRRAYTGGQTTVFANRSEYSVTTDFTLIVIADITTLSNYSGLLSHIDTNTTNGFELRLGETIADGYIDLVRANASNYSVHVASSSSSAVAAGTKDNFIGVSCSKDLAVAPTFNINGTSYPGVVNTSGTGNIAASTSTLNIGRRADGVTYLDGAVSLVLIFGRRLTFAEQESIRANPAQVFADGNENVFSSSVATPGLASTVISGSTSSANLSISVMLSAVAVSGSTSSATLATIPSFTTPQLKNNTGAILASETGVIVNVYNYTTGALVVSLTGLTSNATGYVTVASNSMVSGTQYAYEVVLTAGRRRLPLITAS